MKTLKFAFLVSAVVFILLQILYYPQLPDTVAVHFNAYEQVNGWMSKETNLLLSSIIIVVLTASFAGVPYILKSISPDLINIPKKEYWLSADNKGRLIAIVSTHLYSIGLATNVFMIFLFNELYRFNIHAVDKIAIVVIVPFLIFIFGMTIHLLMHLSKAL